MTHRARPSGRRRRPGPGRDAQAVGLDRPPGEVPGVGVAGGAGQRRGRPGRARAVRAVAAPVDRGRPRDGPGTTAGRGGRRRRGGPGSTNDACSAQKCRAATGGGASTSRVASTAIQSPVEPAAAGGSRHCRWNDDAALDERGGPVVPSHLWRRQRSKTTSAPYGDGTRDVGEAEGEHRLRAAGAGHVGQRVGVAERLEPGSVVARRPHSHSNSPRPVPARRWRPCHAA